MVDRGFTMPLPTYCPLSYSGVTFAGFTSYAFEHYVITTKSRDTEKESDLYMSQ